MVEKKNRSICSVKDRYGRKIDYLRVSITDRCNLRCSYCMPKRVIQFLPSDQILRYEEILRLTDIFIKMGIKKLRITGGEPLIRRNVLFLFRELGKRQALREITLTTNGTMLAHYAEGLFDAGIKRVNISLDTLNRENYRRITGVDQIDTVIEGIKILQYLGITIKLNVVAMKGINDGEFTDFIHFSEQNHIEVRFIEVMPHMYRDTFTKNVFISTESIMQKIGRRYTLLPVSSNANNTTSRIYKIKHSDVKVGFISAVSRPFCSGCNKLRLMADGTLRTCLFSERGKNLKILLSQGITDSEIINEIMAELSEKPQHHELSKDNRNLVMHRVGG